MGDSVVGPCLGMVQFGRMCGIVCMCRVLGNWWGLLGRLATIFCIRLVCLLLGVLMWFWRWFVRTLGIG